MTRTHRSAARCCLALLVWTCTGAFAAAASVPTPFVEFNGRAYHVQVVRTDDGEHQLYFDGQRWFTQDELRAHVAAQPPQVVASDLLDVLARSLPDDELDLTILLRPQPAAALARASRARSAAQLDGLTAAIQAITRESLPRDSLTPAEEREYRPTPLSAEQLQARRALAELRDELARQERAALHADIEAAVTPDQDAVAVYIAHLGGTVYARMAVLSAVGARLPARAVADLAAHPLVAQIDLNRPGEPELDVQRVSLGLTTGFWANGITGGVHDVGVLDTGVQQSHTALNTHPFLSNMGVNDTGSHGTGIAGILASTDTLYRGMAFGCDKIVVALAGDINTSMPGMNYIAGTGEPENVNYSFGNGTATGTDYTTTDQFFDGAISAFGFMVSKSTGNGGYSQSSLTITRPAPAYNLMAVGNINDFNTVSRADDRTETSSSVGPTVAGRKKPDLCAPGTNSMSTYPSGGFQNIGGTSAAAPHVGGAVVLLWDMGNTSAMGAKAVLLNTTDAMTDNGTSTTADDAFVNGSLWNRRYGWGYLNLGNAYLHALNVFLDSVPAAPENADFRLYAGQMFTHERATLVWQRHVAYNGATFPTQIEALSNLDLFAYREFDNTLVASSTSAIDNVEQLHVNADAFVVLKVEATGQFDPDIASEDFALATQENFVAATGPAFAPTFTVPFAVLPGSAFNVSVTVQNAGDLAAHAVSVTLSGASVIGGANPAPLGTILAGQSGIANWTVQAAAVPGTYPLSAGVTSNSYGETFTGSGAGSYTASPAGCTGDTNCDGAVSFDDIDAFVLALQGQAAYAAQYPDCAWLNADCNEDGGVTFDDIDPFVALIGTECR